MTPERIKNAEEIELERQLAETRAEIARVKAELEGKKVETPKVKPPEPPAISEATKKAQAIAQLEKTIAINETIMAEATRELEAILLRQAQTENKSSIENISIAEKIGNAFVEFCKNEDNLISIGNDELLNLLKPLRNESMFAMAKIVYRTSSAQTVYFYDERPKQSNSKAILVNVGHENYILPYPLSTKDLDTVVDVFDYQRGNLIPIKLQKVVAAEVIEDGKGWSLKKMGQLI